MNQELVTIFQEDQQDRKASGLDPDYLQRDRARRQRVAELVAAGALASPDDYAMAAVVFQHGETPDDFLQAHRLAVKAVELGLKDIAWLAAAALDRHLVRQGKPVKYGCQNVRMGGIYRVPRIDPATTDEERAAWGIEPLAQILAQSSKDGLPSLTDLDSLAAGNLRITVRSLPRPLTWHSEMLPDRHATGLTTPSGRPVWANVQGWHWAETDAGDLHLGWTEILYAPELGHMVAQAERADLAEAEVDGRPAIWVNTGEPLWTLYAVAPEGDRVWAVTGLDRIEITHQMESLLGGAV
jgi:hypothetical protein